MPLVKPTVHLNGTSKEALFCAYEEAAEKVYQAIEGMALVTPNGRDYYPQGNDVIWAASAQHRERVKKLREVYAELQEIMEGLA